MLVVCFIIRIYNDARSPERQIQERRFDFSFRFMYLNVMKMVTEMSKHVTVVTCLIKHKKNSCVDGEWW